MAGKKATHKGAAGPNGGGHAGGMKGGLIASPMAKTMEGKKGHAGKK